jgi:hypothetical protein
MGERNGFRYFQVHVVIVREDGVVRSHEPTGHELVGMDVQEKRQTGGQRYGDLADHSPELARGAGLRRSPEQVRRRGVRRDGAANEGLVRKNLTIVHVDTLEHDAQFADDLADRLPGRCCAARRRVDPNARSPPLGIVC